MPHRSSNLSPEAQIRFARQDKDKDDLIGTAIVELDHAPQNEVSRPTAPAAAAVPGAEGSVLQQDWALEDWFEIEDENGKRTGSIHVQLSWAMPRDRGVSRGASRGAGASAGGASGGGM